MMEAAGSCEMLVPLYMAENSSVQCFWCPDLEYIVIWLQLCARINIIKSSRTVLWPKKDVPWMVAMTALEVAHFPLTVTFPSNPIVCCY